ncbi:MAG: enolase C-terminal domain-like protein [Bryobacteraceae bacterium]
MRTNGPRMGLAGMTRRGFMGSLAAFPLIAKDAPPIRSIEVFPLRYPVIGRFKFLPNPERDAVFVKVTCEGGATGWGQSVPLPAWSYETLESVTSTLRLYLAPALIGKNPTDIEQAHRLMNHAIAASFSTGMPIAKAGLDLALHDLTGKLAAKSLPELWGRKPLARIPLSWTVNVTSLVEVAPLMAEGRQRGYQHFNIKVGPDPKFDIAFAREVRRIAPASFLWADGNGGYDTERALFVAPRLRDAGVNVLEQPVAPNNLSGLAALKKQAALPLILDEGVVSVTDLEEFHKLNLLDGVAEKPARTAGLWDGRRQVEYLERNHLMFLGSGLTDPDVSLAASLALFGAYGVKHPAALNGLQFLGGSFLKQPFRVEEGSLRVPTGAGLGVEIDEEKIRHVSRE